MENKKLLSVLFFILAICSIILAKSLQVLNELFPFSNLVSFNLNEFNALFNQLGVIYLIISFSIFLISKLVKKENLNVINLKKTGNAFIILGFFIFTGGLGGFMFQRLWNAQKFISHMLNEIGIIFTSLGVIFLMIGIITHLISEKCK